MLAKNARNLTRQVATLQTDVLLDQNNISDNLFLPLKTNI